MKAVHLFTSPSKKPFPAVILFCLPLFFLLLADNIMSYIFPIAVESATNSNTLLGIIMALSSVVGIICDFTFPQIFKQKTWRFMLIIAILLAIFFPISTYLGSSAKYVNLFIIGTIIWGIYYEFLSFSQQSFIISEDSSGEYTKDWGIIYAIGQITAILGPIIGSFLLGIDLLVSNFSINFIQVLSLILAAFVIWQLPYRPLISEQIEIKSLFTVRKEVNYWRILSFKIWPLILTNILVISVTATYWTLGGLLGQELVGKYNLDWLVMVLYFAPLVLGSLILVKVPVMNGKKRLSNISLLIGGIILSSIFFFQTMQIAVFIVIVLSSFALSFAGPLNEAVYSDLLDRMGKSRLHLIGLSKATVSVAFIIAPLATGILADKIGYYATFSFLGIIVAIIALLLLVLTPKKLKLPQTELKVLDQI